MMSGHTFRTALAADGEQLSGEARIAMLRSRIDDLDIAVADLLSERAQLSGAVQQTRLADRAARLDSGREHRVRRRYTSVLGPRGACIAEAVLTLCRGSLNHDRKER